MGQASNLECQGLALAAVQDDLLRGGLFHLEAGSGFHLSHRVLAGVQALTRLMKFDLAMGIREEIAIVDGCGRFGGFAVAGMKRWLWPMVCAITLPDVVYIYLKLLRLCAT